MLPQYGKCPKLSYTKVANKMTYANSIDPDQTCTTTIYYRSLTWNPFYCIRIFPKEFWPFECFFVFVSFWSCFFFFFFFWRVYTLWKAEKKNIKITTQQFTNRSNKQIIVPKFFFLRLSREKSVKSMCDLKIYLIHKTTHAQLVNRRRIDRNKIRSGDKIQNSRDRKFCRLMS